MYIESPNYIFSNERSDPLMFLAGPIQGAPNWQKEITDFVKSRTLKLDVANPRRAVKPEGIFNYEEQVEWETTYLNLSDVIIFCIPKSIEDIEGRVYAQTTRFELGEWLSKASRLRNKKIIVWIDKDIPLYRYCKTKILTEYETCAIWCESYRELLYKIEEYAISMDKLSTNIFFTSDTHFGAQRTLELSKRPFKNVNEMDKILINNWNDAVKPKDIVYHLGDFGNFEVTKYLNGHIRFILGNYEKRDIEQGKYSIPDLDKYFETVNEYPIDINLMSSDGAKAQCKLMHEPENYDPEKFNLFGHIHGRRMIKKYGLDVGTDCHNFTPISLDDCMFFCNALHKGYYDNNVFDKSEITNYFKKD